MLSWPSVVCPHLRLGDCCTPQKILTLERVVEEEQEQVEEEEAVSMVTV